MIRFVTRTLSLLAALALIGLGAPNPSIAADKVFTIPVIVPMTGVGAEYGAGDKIALDIAVNEINSHGGIDGYKLALNLSDDGSQPTQAATIMHGLIGSSLVILGPNLSGTCKAAFPISNGAGVPTVTGSASDATILADNRPWTFNTHIVAQVFSKEAAARFVKATKAKTMVAIIDKDSAAPIAQGNELVKALEGSGVKMLKTINIGEGQATYSAEADAAKSLNADAYMISAYPDATGPMAKALRGSGVKAPIIFTTTSVTQDSIRVGGEAMTNSYVLMQSWPGVGNKRKLAFDAEFARVSKGLPEVPTAPFLYDAVYVIADALKSTHVLTSTKSLPERRQMVRDALARVHFLGTTGWVDFSNQGVRTVGGLWSTLNGGKLSQVR